MTKISLNNYYFAKTICVTGGFGFIGSALIKKLLLLAPKKIIIIDNLDYGDIANLEVESCEKTEISFFKIDLGNTSVDELSVILEGCDYIFHLAAEKHNQSIENPKKVIDVNISGTFALYKAAVKTGVTKIIFSSTLYVYGRNYSPPYSENDKNFPNTIYGISKLTSELFGVFFSSQGILDIINLRYLFVYGPRQYANQGYKSVIVKNFERIINGMPPIIFGDGEQVLDYIYVEDVVNYTIQSIILPSDIGPVNICSGNGISIKELTFKMIQVSSYSGEIEYAEYDHTRNSFRVGDPTKLQNILAIDSITPIEKGLKSTYDWIKKRNG